MLYDFQEQNSLQLAEGLVFDSFLWLFYNCLQIFSSFKLFRKVLGEAKSYFVQACVYLHESKSLFNLKAPFQTLVFTRLPFM